MTDLERRVRELAGLTDIGEGHYETLIRDLWAALRACEAERDRYREILSALTTAATVREFTDAMAAARAALEHTK